MFFLFFGIVSLTGINKIKMSLCFIVILIMHQKVSTSKKKPCEMRLTLISFGNTIWKQVLEGWK